MRWASGWKWIAATLAFVCCALMAVLAALDMERAWGSAACSVGSVTSQDLSRMTTLQPEFGWTAYVQSGPHWVSADAPPGHATQADVLHFLGEPSRIAFFPVMSGRLPLSGEVGVCALDQDTSFRLFGGIDPGDGTVRLNGKLLRAIGVIDVPSPLALVPAAQDEVFVRLAADDRNALLALANALGIEPDPFELGGAELSQLAWLLCALPWLLGAVFVLASIRKWGAGWRMVSTVFVCALSLGALLALLWCIPVRLLPARWSDFAFYKEQMAARKARPFRLPDVRDELLKSDMLHTGFWCAMACIACLCRKTFFR